MAKSLVWVQNMANMAALERSRDMTHSRKSVRRKICSLDKKMPSRKAKLTEEKSSDASEMKTSDGREYFPTKILSPRAPSGEIILSVPVIQPRKMVTKTWQMVGRRSSKLTALSSSCEGQRSGLCHALSTLGVNCQHDSISTSNVIFEEFRTSILSSRSSQLIESNGKCNNVKNLSLTLKPC